METIKLTTTFPVTPKSIKHKDRILEYPGGFSILPRRVEDGRYGVLLEKVRYKDLRIGNVFLVGDSIDEYNFNDPSSFMLKREAGGWYLKDDQDAPLGVDRSEYETVWRVVKDNVTQTKQQES